MTVVNTEPVKPPTKAEKRDSKKRDNAAGGGGNVPRKRGLHDAEHRARSANMGHSSTFSKEYDHKNADETWICVFCKKHTHYKGK